MAGTQRVAAKASKKSASKKGGKRAKQHAPLQLKSFGIICGSTVNSVSKWTYSQLSSSFSIICG